MYKLLRSRVGIAYESPCRQHSTEMGQQRASADSETAQTTHGACTRKRKLGNGTRHLAPRRPPEVREHDVGGPSGGPRRFGDEVTQADRPVARGWPCVAQIRAGLVVIAVVKRRCRVRIWGQGTLSDVFGEQREEVVIEEPVCLSERYEHARDEHRRHAASSLCHMRGPQGSDRSFETYGERKYDIEKGA